MTLISDLHDGVLTLTLNRPDKLHAFTGTTYKLGTALERTGMLASEKVPAITLTTAVAQAPGKIVAGQHHVGDAGRRVNQQHITGGAQFAEGADQRFRLRVQ